MNSTFKRFVVENMQHSAVIQAQISITQITTNFIGYFGCAAYSNKCLALQALQLKWHAGITPGRGFQRSCAPPALFSNSSQCSCLSLQLNGHSSATDWQQNMQHRHSTLRHFVITSALSSSSFLHCPIHHSLHFYSCSVGRHLHLGLPFFFF